MGKAWEKSGELVWDNDGVVAPGAEAYFFVGGTGTTPLTVYSDSVEATPRTHPVEADANGRWPLTFIPFCTSYDVQVLTSGGAQLYFYQNLPNPDPVEAAEDTVDDEQLLQTGDWVFVSKAGTRSGFVRANGRTIGSAASGATERANADTADLYAYLWNNHTDAICAVSTGRGGSAAADFAANKTITLFDCKGGSPRGLDDMGGSAAGSFSVTPFSTGAATTAGSKAGLNSHILTLAQLASHTHLLAATSFVGLSATNVETGNDIGAATDPTNSSGTGSAGSDTAHNNVPISILGTWLIKL